MPDFINDIIGSIQYNLIIEDRWKFLVDGFILTLILTLASFISATAIGGLLAWMKNSRVKWVRKTAFFIVEFFLRVPSMVLLMLALYVIFIEVPLSTMFIAIVVFSLKSAAYICDIFYSSLKSVSVGEGEAARSLGMSKFQSFYYVTLPQAIRFALPLYKNQFIISLQETAIVGSFGIQDLTRASDVIASRTFDPFTSLIVVTVLYIITGLAFSLLLKPFSRRKHIGGGVS